MATADVVFDALACLLDASAIRADASARPISFELLDEQGDTWSFDPHRAGPLFAPEPHPEPALTITCRPQTLLRLIRAEPFVLDADEPVLLAGDPDALDHLIACLRDEQSILDLQMRRGSAS